MDRDPPDQPHFCLADDPCPIFFRGNVCAFLLRPDSERPQEEFHLRLAKESGPHLLLLLGGAAVSWPFAPVLTLFFAAAAGAVAFFFRDPPRRIPASEEGILSPADGRVKEILRFQDRKRIWIYLSPLDVHINRLPISGQVREVTYSPGKFLPAFSGKAVRENESNLVVIRNGSLEVGVRQMAGTLARRIVCYCRVGDRVRRGDKMGLIQFGSGVQLILPAGCEVRVRVGQRVRGGETLIARFLP